MTESANLSAIPSFGRRLSFGPRLGFGGKMLAIALLGLSSQLAGQSGAMAADSHERAQSASFLASPSSFFSSPHSQLHAGLHSDMARSGLMGQNLGKSHSPAQLLGDSLADMPELGANFASFTLDNGLEVVVIPDHRAPVVTHMIWYKVGAADEPVQQSGIAHFLEHLMFKGTTKYPDGEFSKIVAELGGQENAFTGQDYTAYYQRVAKEHLPKMMEMEADRMTNLVLRDDQVEPELQVVHEERTTRIDNNPSSQLSEAVSAALYRNHPYGIPIIGWDHEIAELNREKALAFYEAHYTPNNAVLVVAGDVNEAEVRKLVEQYYGPIARRAEVGPRVRPQEPPQRTARMLTLRHERVRQPSIRRSYLVPSSNNAQDGEAEALELLGYILGSGSNSRLYRSLIIDQKIATNVGAFYRSGGLDDTVFVFYGVPAADKSLDDVMAGVDAELETLIKDGVTKQEMDRAKRSILSEAFYAQDSQASLARIVGANLSTGASLQDLRDWPKRLAGVTPEAVVAVAKKYLKLHRSVTGRLLPPQKTATPSTAMKPMADKARSMAAAKAGAVEPGKAKAKQSALNKDKAQPVKIGGVSVHPAGSPKAAPRMSVKVPTPTPRPPVPLYTIPRSKPAAKMDGASYHQAPSPMLKAKMVKEG